MALSDLSGYHQWIERERPTVAASETVLAFLVVAAQRPWVAPSRPIDELSVAGVDQVRIARIDLPDGTMVDVVYRETFPRASTAGVGLVDVIAVMAAGD